MASDPNTLARIAEARAFLGPLGPANLDDLLKDLKGASPPIVFRSEDGQRRISAGRVATWYPRGTVEIIYLDGYTTADDSVRNALFELMFLSTGCGIRELNVLNGKLQIPSAAGWVTVG